jgi:ribonuclease HII
MDLSLFSISEIKQHLEAAQKDELEAILIALAVDPRAGARRLAISTENRLAREARESARLNNMMKYEADLAERGYSFIAGADEVGRGALAGPLVAAAVILRPGARIVGINDSKKLSSGERERLAGVIQETALAWAVAEVSQTEIDDLGLQAANVSALFGAVERLDPAPDYAIFDGFKVDCGAIPSVALIKGDSLSQTVAAASVLAKVYRDRIMLEHHARYPDYGFDVNKGYGTGDHIAAIKKTGPCTLHRRSFYPLSELYSNQLTLNGSEGF